MRLIDADSLYSKFKDGESDTYEERCFNQLARYLIRHEKTIVSPLPVNTCDLVEELKKREGVDVYVVENGRCMNVSASGPALVLVVTD